MIRICLVCGEEGKYAVEHKKQYFWYCIKHWQDRSVDVVMEHKHESQPKGGLADWFKYWWFWHDGK